MATTGKTLIPGMIAPDFTLIGIDGNPHALSSIFGSAGLVVVFMCNHCPYVLAQIPMMVALYPKLQAMGVNMIAINSNSALVVPEDDYPAMQAFAQKHRLPFAYLHDASQAVAKAFDAVCTPEYFGFNAERTLCYRGCMVSGGSKNWANGRNELEAAMQQIVASGSAPSVQNPSLGCSIKWRP